MALVALAALAGVFLAGRATVDRGGGRTAGGEPAPVRVQTPAPPRGHGGYATGYRAGREDAFAGFDGGWSFGSPYIVTLRRGPAGVTYRFDRRWPMLPGIEYRACGQGVCTRRAH